MTVGQIMLEAEKLNDEELNNLINNVSNLKKTRDEAKKEKAVQKLREAWDSVISLGIDIYDNEGNLITNFEDLECYY